MAIERVYSVVVGCALFNFIYALPATDVVQGPDKPHNLSVSVTDCYSADLGWISGYDYGSHQTFFVMRGVGNGSFIQWSNEISAPYEHGGEGQSWTHHVTGLECGTEYEFGVLARNAYNISFSDPLYFNTTVPDAPVKSPHNVKTTIIVGCSIAGFFVLLMFVGACTRRSQRTIFGRGREKLDHRINAPSDDSLLYGSNKESGRNNVFPYKPYTGDSR